MDLTLTCKNVRITPSTSYIMEAELEDVSAIETLDQIDASIAVDHYGSDTLLDIIGEEKARKYFGLEDAA